MFGRIGVEMAGRACRADMMEMFADKEKKRITCGHRQEECPPWTGAQAFRQNRKEGDAEKSSGGEADDRAQLFERQAKGRADASTGKGKDISGNNLPKLVSHLMAGHSHLRRVLATTLR